MGSYCRIVIIDDIWAIVGVFWPGSESFRERRCLTLISDRWRRKATAVEVFDFGFCQTGQVILIYEREEAAVLAIDVYMKNGKS